MISFVIAVNDRDVLKSNFLASPCVSARDEVILQEGFSSAALAYNDALARARNDTVVFVHQDVFLPEDWTDLLTRSLEYLKMHDPDWGVLGCFGVTGDGGERGHVFTTGWGLLGSPFERPLKVRTLDEMVLILRKGSGLQFDESLPHFHFYGADICLQAEKRGMRCYVIPAFCLHNTDQILYLPRAFFDCYSHFKARWLGDLPVRTSCIRVTRFNADLYERRFRELFRRYFQKERKPRNRLSDPAAFWKELKASC